MFTSLAQTVDSKTLEEIHTLENEIGHPLLAFTFYDIEPARLDGNTLTKIKKFEEDRCICLLAVTP